MIIEQNKLVSIDSINNTIKNLEQKISSFEKNNQVLRDSVNNLTKVIQNAGVKTEFYTDQLNFQLFWFSLILGVIGFISWKSYITPLINKINITTDELSKLNNETLPNNKKEIDELIVDKMIPTDNDLQDLTDDNNRKYHFLLTSLSQTFLIQNNYLFYFFYKLKIIEHYFHIDDYEDNNIEEIIIKDLEDLLLVAKNEKIRTGTMGKINIEVLAIFSKIIETDCHHKIKSISEDIIKIINTPLKSPETSYDIDLEEAPI